MARKSRVDESEQYSCVSTKLNSILSNTFKPWLLPLFDDISYRLSRIVFEAYVLANLHLVRCLTEGKDLPTLNQSYFYSCCSNVSASTREAGSEELRETAETSFSLRPEGFDVTKTTYLSHAICSHAQMMETMAKNHIVLNLVSRLCDYIRLKYTAIERKSVALSFLRYAVYEEDERMLTDDVKDFKRWFGPVNPFHQSEVEENLPHVIKKLHEILLFYDTLDPNTKRLKRFTLLPLKGDYIQSHFFIDSTTLPDLLKLLDRHVQQAIVKMMIPQFEVGSEERMFLEERVQANTIFDQKFQQMQTVSNCLWRVLFNIKKFETSRRKFAKRISTDGCSASISLQVPAVPNATDVDYDVLRRDDVERFTTFIGIDPGRDYVCSSFSGKLNNKGKSRCVQVSTQELRHDAKMIRQKKWMRKQTQRYQEYGRISTSVPTLKVGSLAVLLSNIKLTLESMEYLFAFQRKLGFRNWRFKTRRFGEKALVKAVRKILDGAQEVTKTLVGFGDWSEQDGGFLKGSEKAPVKKMRRMMRDMGIKVVKIDEYRTSKCCSQCMKGDNENVKFNGKESHRIIRCNNSECKTYWHRDVNGSRNIRSVLLSMVQGQAQRPEGLRRTRKRCRSIHS